MQTEVYLVKYISMHGQPTSRPLVSSALWLISRTNNRAEAVAAQKTKRDSVAELHYITRGARNVKDPNFEVS